MSLLLQKKVATVVPLPFVIGILMGLCISYGIRLLSKPSLCRHNILPEHTTHLSQLPTPDQVVNIAGENSDDVSDIKNSRSLKGSDPCTSEYECDGKVSNPINRESRNKQRKLLFVGVMTATTFLDTRAKAVWETWGREIQGKVMFFTGSESYNGRKQDNETIPLVPLPNVDDSYPPQKKSFMMLKYMYENYGDDYEWFMRADDDVYIRADKLAELLRSIDSRHLHFIGQAGKGNLVEKGTLNLAHNENFCMGGPGIIMSRPTLKKVAPNVYQCLKDMYSTHEDVEVGRCVQRFAGVSCTWSYEMQTIFHHNSSVDLAFTGKLKRREVHKAITLHPVKSPSNVYRIHAYFQGLRRQSLMHQKIQLHRELLTMSQILSNATTLSGTLLSLLPFSNSTKLEEIMSIGMQPTVNKFRPKEIESIIQWDFLRKGVYSAEAVSPKLKLRSDSKEALEDVVREVMEMINSLSRVKGRTVDFKDILYGYKSHNPVYGIDYILDLLLTYRKYRGRKMTVPVRRHVYVQRPFGPLEIHMSPVYSSVTSRPTNLVMIVPLSGRFDTLERFLNGFTSTCLDLYDPSSQQQSQGNSIIQFRISLVVVFFGTENEKDTFLLLVQEQRDKLTKLLGNQESVCKIRNVQLDGEFSRSIALETGISQCNDEDLLFLIDVDLTFSAEVLKRVHSNTVRGKQVYFPVAFSLYNPKFYDSSTSNNLSFSCCKSQDCHQINSENGYWREFGYGITSFYKSDFRLTGGFDTSIKGWGKEDVALFDRFLQHTNLTIFRAPDPHLIHIYHEIECDSKLPKPQLDMCLGSRASTQSSQLNLMKYLLLHE